MLEACAKCTQDGFLLRAIRRIVSDLTQYDDGRQADLSVLDAHQSQLDLAFREIVAILIVTL